MTYIDIILKNKGNLKGEYKIDNTKIKVIGIGPKALKVLVFEPSKFVKKPCWKQQWFNYDDLTDSGKDLIDLMVKSLSI